MARNLISSGSMEDMDTYNNANHGGGGGDNPPSGGVLSPEPEKIERVRDYTTPGGSTEKKMTPEERKLPHSGANMGSSDPNLTPPIHERTVTASGKHGMTVDATPGTGIAGLDALHDAKVQAAHDAGMASGVQPSIAMSHPVNTAPPGGNIAHADPFSNPGDYKAVPGTNKMEYAPGTKADQPQGEESH